MKKLAISLVFLLVFSGFSATQSLAASFKDLNQSNTFYDEIQYLMSEDIISGFSDGTFRPKAEVTRAQAAIMLGRALGYEGKQQNTKFKDVTASQAASGYIAEAVAEGIISGYTDGTYKPYQTVTRAEMAIFIYRAFDLGEVNYYNSFVDVSSSMSSHDAINQLAAWGVAGGYTDGTFRPYVSLTREQFSAFLARAVNPEEFALDVNTDFLNVEFLNVGQGDAIYIEYPNGKTALIDAGRYASVIEEALTEAGITQIDTFIATHPDADHIGGAAHVIENYGVTHVVDSGQVHTTQVFTDYLEAVERSGATFQVAEIGDNLSDDAAVSAEVLWVDDSATDLNDGSIVLKLTHEEIDYLLTGDAGVEVEEQLIGQADLDAEILKVSHHGSDTGTSQAFLDAVTPELAILSVGPNGYGHPNAEVIDRLTAMDVWIYSTEDGTVGIIDDGSYYDIYQGMEEVPEVEPEPPTEEEEGQTSDALRITGKNLDTEVVTIKNTGTADVDMSGWTLVSVEGSQGYRFQSFVLKAGASVNVTSGPNAVENPPSSYAWTGGYIWNNSGDAAELYDPSGKLIHRLP